MGYNYIIDMGDHWSGYNKEIDRITLTGFQQWDIHAWRREQTEKVFIKKSFADVRGRDPHKKQFSGIVFPPGLFLSQQFVPEKSNGKKLYYVPVKITVIAKFSQEMVRTE